MDELEKQVVELQCKYDYLSKQNDSISKKIASYERIVLPLTGVAAFLGITVVSIMSGIWDIHANIDNAKQDAIDEIYEVKKTATNILGIKHETKYGGSDTRNNGKVNGRKLQYRKVNNDSLLRVLYTDALKSEEVDCSWEITFNDFSCPSQALVYKKYENGAGYDHSVTTMVGYCPGLKGGEEYEIEVFVKSSHKKTKCNTGHDDGNVWVLEVQEIMSR